MKWTYRQEYVKCGKKGCGRCPHGPYWYAYMHEKDRMWKRYVGKNDPRAKPGAPAGKPAAPVDPRDAIFNRRTASTQLARQILGFAAHWTKAECHKAYKALVMKHHPDRGGDEHECRLVTAAWSFLEAYLT